MNIPILILIVLFLESLPEASVYKGGYHGHGCRIFGKFRLNYHVPLFFRWTLTCIAVTVLTEWSLDWRVIANGASLVFAYASFQDVGYWFWSDEWPTADSWIGKMFGGFTVFDVFYPHAWWMGPTASYALIWGMG